MPGELRNYIYELALSLESDEPIHITQPYLYRPPALLAVSQQMRQETLSLYYTSHMFEAKITGMRLELSKRWIKAHLPEVRGSVTLRFEVEKVFFYPLRLSSKLVTDEQRQKALISREMQSLVDALGPKACVSFEYFSRGEDGVIEEVC